MSGKSDGDKGKGAKAADTETGSAVIGGAVTGGAAGEVIPLIRKKRRCPTCGRPGGVEFRPFCSKRCADVDLGRWLKGGYRIPGEPVPQEAPDPEEDS